MKRVLLFVVDGCTSRVMRPAVERGELPALAALIERGRIDYDCVSVFPSITPAATASIVTGRYPREHGIAGMSWWNPEASKVSYFGDDVWTVLRRGIETFLRDFMLQINGGRLRAPTLFQTAERAGLQAGWINHLIFKGDVSHSGDLPTLLRLLPSVPSDLEVRGPSRLCLGDFVCGGFGEGKAPSGVPFSRFGLDDQGTEDVLLSVPDAGALPDFTVAYFADSDFDSHDEGPEAALETLRRVDGRLTRVFEAWGGLDRVLSEACIMLTADHSHCEIAREDPGIDLAEALRDWTLADPAAGWQDDEDLMICPNMPPRKSTSIVRRQRSSMRSLRLCSHTRTSIT